MKAQMIFDTEEKPQLILVAETPREKEFLKALPEGEYEAFKRNSFTERQGGFMMCSGYNEDNAIALRPIIKKRSKN